MRAADYLVDFGPGPGVRGGEVVAAGTYAEVVANADSLTGQYLSGREADRRSRTSAGSRQRQASAHRRRPAQQPQEHHGRDPARPVRLRHRRQRLGQEFARQRHPHARDCRPRPAERKRTADEDEEDDEERQAHRRSARTTASTAPSTSTRSSTSISRRSAARRARTRRPTSRCSTRSARCSPQMPEAKVRGYKPGRFSFNKPGGRCEACEGNGSNRLEMDFLADVWVTCPVCEGRRFNRETLQVRFKGKNIHDVLEMDVQEALEHFAERAEDPRHAADAARRRPRLHQARPARRRRSPAARRSASSWPANCAGAAPARRSTSSTSRPPACTSTTSSKLLQVLHGFVEAGNTVVVIEHNLDVIKTADWIIDLGPEGGGGGGERRRRGHAGGGRRVRAVVHRPGAASRC